MIVHPKTKTLIRYADKDLSEAQAERIRRHLDRCERCRKEYRILQRIEAVNAPKKDLMDNFKDRIVANLKEAKRVNQPICADIKATIGKVLVYQTGDDEGIEGFPGMGLKKGDTVRLLGDSRALIELNDGSTVYLNKDTEISLPSARYDMAMMVGEIFAMMKPQKKAFEICTPSAILGVIGTDFDARVTEKKETILQVLKGKVSFKNASGSTIVRKKHQVEATRNTKPIPKKIKDTQTIYNWTIPMKRKKTERGWIMDKLYLVIPALLAVGILIGGYFIYQAYFTYEPSYYPTSSGEKEIQPPSISATETPSTEGKYAKWLGDWVPEEELDPTEPFYLHVELNSSGLPRFDIKILEGFTEKRPPIVLELVGTLDDSSVKLKFEVKDMPKEMSMEVILKHNPATDKLEWMGIAYKNGEKIEQEGKVFFIRKERWEELASKGLLPSDTSEVQIRSKVSRGKADMRVMAVALEAYYVDNNSFPASVPGSHPFAYNKASATRKMPSFRLGVKTKSPDGREIAIPMTVTTPLAYITRYFKDPFQVSPTDPQPTFAYYGDRNGWILISPGPDGDYDINPAKDYSSDIRQPTLQLLLKAYDPTNGTVSGGDVFRVKQ